MFYFTSKFKFDSSLEILNVSFKTFGNDDTGARLKGAQVDRGGHWARTQGGSADHGALAAQAVVEKKRWRVLGISRPLQSVHNGVALEQGQTGANAMEARHT